MMDRHHDEKRSAMSPEAADVARQLGWRSRQLVYRGRLAEAAWDRLYRQGGRVMALEATEVASAIIHVNEVLDAIRRFVRAAPDEPLSVQDAFDAFGRGAIDAQLALEVAKDRLRLVVVHTAALDVVFAGERLVACLLEEAGALARGSPDKHLSAAADDAVKRWLRVCGTYNRESGRVALPFIRDLMLGVPDGD